MKSKRRVRYLLDFQCNTQNQEDLFEVFLAQFVKANVLFYGGKKRFANCHLIMQREDGAIIKDKMDYDRR